MCRTCECLGLQNVWILDHPPPEQVERCETSEDLASLEKTFALPNSGKGICKVMKYLTWRRFRSIAAFHEECKQQKLEVRLREGGHTHDPTERPPRRYPKSLTFSLTPLPPISFGACSAFRGRTTPSTLPATTDASPRFGPAVRRPARAAAVA